MNRVFADRSHWNTGTGYFTHERRRGIPLSAAQQSTVDYDFQAYRQSGVPLVGLASTVGLGFVDPTHLSRAVDAHNAGVWVMHYHFGYADQDPVAQARFFWLNTKPTFARRDVLCIDIEEGGRHGVAFPLVREWTLAFDRELHRLSGHRQVTYSNESFLQSLGFTPILSNAFWVAKVSAVPPAVDWIKKPWAWQFSFSTDLPGVGSGDANLLNLGSYLWFRSRKP